MTFRLTALLIVLMLFPGACSRMPEPRRLQTVDIRLGGKTIRVEAARTPSQRSFGMKYRTEVGHDEGMLFVFPKDAELAFYMKDTFVPLSIAFIRSDGTIARIDDMEPQSTRIHRSGVRCRYALEMPLGWFAEHGIHKGTTLEIPQKILAGEIP